MGNFLSNAQRAKLADVLNKEINIPVIKENTEFKVFAKIVDAVDALIRSKVQDEVLATLNSKNLQIEDMIKVALKENLVPLVSTLFLPVLPAVVKQKALGFLVDFLVEAMAGATTIDEQIEAFLADA